MAGIATRLPAIQGLRRRLDRRIDRRPGVTTPAGGGVPANDNFIDDYGITSFVDDNGVTSFTDDLGN